MSKHFNKLTEAELDRLAILAEECGEVQKAVGKILRHGYDSFNPDDRTAGSNRLQLLNECGDLLFSIRQMCGGDTTLDLDWDMIERRSAFKSRTIKKYLHHQPNPG